MEPLSFSHEIGIVSGILLVVAYGLLNFGVLTTNSPMYQALNVLGALGFTYTAVSPFNPGLLITEIVWAIAAGGFLWKIFTRRKQVRGEVADTGAVLVSAPSGQERDPAGRVGDPAAGGPGPVQETADRGAQPEVSEKIGSS